MEYISVIAAGASFLASGIVALIAWGMRGELSTLRSEIDKVRMELRASIAEAGLQFFKDVNGKYVAKGIHDEAVARLDRIENRVENLE